MNPKLGKYLYTLRHIKRFNGVGHPSKRRQDYATHTYVTLAISSLINHKYNYTHSKNPISMERVYGKIIFGALHPTFFGDVPKFIKNEYPELGDAFQVAKKTSGVNLVFEFSEKYQEQFTDYIVNTKDDSIEGEIVKQSENFSVLLKCEEELKAISNRYFKKLKYLIQEHIIKNKPLEIPNDIIEELQDEQYEGFEKTNFFDTYLQTIDEIKKTSLEEVKWFFKEIYFTPITLFIKEMQEVFRWNNRKGDVDTDSPHSLYVAMWAFILGLIERNNYGREIDIARMVNKAIYHDMHEVITADLLSYVKRINKDIKSLIDTMEHDVNLIVLSFVPQEFRDSFKDYIVEPKTDDPEGHLIGVADKIDAAIKALQETKHRRSLYFEQAYDNGMRAIIEKAQDYPSIKDFFTYMLHEFIVDPDA